MATNGIADSPVAEDKLNIRGKQFHVTLTRSHFIWKSVTEKKDHCHTTSLELRDLIIAKTEERNNSKYGKSSFSVHFIEVQTNLEWVKKKEVFSCPETNHAKEWTEKICQTLNEEVPNRPKKLLVFINPLSGRGKAVELYKKKAAPVFELAGVLTEVIETQDGDHGPKVIEEKDLDEYDGIVATGGDGSLMLILGALLKRTMKEAGKDINNPNEPLLQPKIPMGILPTGTGMGVAEGLLRSRSCEVAALHIVTGRQVPMNVYSSHAEGKLFSYGSLLVGYGIFVDMMEYAEKNRSKGFLRYAIAFAKAGFMTYRIIDLEVKYLPYKEGATVENATEEDWLTVKGEFVILASFLCEFKKRDWGEPYMSLFLVRPCTKIQLFTFFKKMALGEVENANLPYVVLAKAIAYKLSIKTPFEGSHPLTGVIELDGEVMKMAGPELDVRLQVGAFKMMGNGYFRDAENKKLIAEIKQKKKS